MNPNTEIGATPPRANIAETLAKEMKEPKLIATGDGLLNVAVPSGWHMQEIEREQVLEAPRRINTKASAAAKLSFIEYAQRHADATSTVWCSRDAVAGKLSFQAIFDDFKQRIGNDFNNRAAWRGHRIDYTPIASVEWARWMSANGKQFGQEAFAAFLEENLQDVVAADGFPSGGDILKMALDFEAKQDSSFRSAVRLQSGGVRMEFVASDDKGTVEAMTVFERFQIGVPVFRDDEVRYPVTVRLRYRTGSGKVTFWIELVRPDLVFEQAANAVVAAIKDGCKLPFFFGQPG